MSEAFAQDFSELDRKASLEQNRIDEIFRFLESNRDRFSEELALRGVTFHELQNFLSCFLTKWRKHINLGNHLFSHHLTVVSVIAHFVEGIYLTWQELERVLLNKITINDTKFFRAKSLIALPSFLKETKGNRQFRLASWPSSTGQEAVSMLTFAHFQGVSSQVYGFDINPSNVDKAQQSLNEMDHRRVVKMLSEIPHDWKLNDGGRVSDAMNAYYANSESEQSLLSGINDIRFAVGCVHTDDLYHQAFDGAVSLNLLMHRYLSPQQAIEFFRRMFERLVPSGVLLIDQVMFDSHNDLHSEFYAALKEMDKLFERVRYPFLGTDYIFLQKKS